MSVQPWWDCSASWAWRGPWRTPQQVAWPTAYTDLSDPDVGIFELLPRLGGDTLSTVAAKLERAGVIKSALVFKVEARVDGKSDTSIKTGKYTFEPGADTDAILSKLTAGRAVPVIHAAASDTRNSTVPAPV